MKHFHTFDAQTQIPSKPLMISLKATSLSKLTIRFTLQTCILVCLLVTETSAVASDMLNGSWVFNKKRSDDLQDVMEVIRRANQEEIDQREEEKQKRTSKPDAFGRNREWDDRRARGATAPIPKLMRTMISSEVIKIYFSRKLAISYDKEIKRLLTPNPNGRVYSATGAGLSRDAVGETLSYVEDDIIYIETRTKIGKIKERLDPHAEPGRLVITWEIEAPAMEYPVEMVTVYDKQ